MAVSSTPSEEQVERVAKNKEDLVKRIVLCIMIGVIFGLCVLSFFYKHFERVWNGIAFVGIVFVYTDYVDRLWLKSIMASIPSVDDQATTQVNSVDKNLNRFRMILHPVIAFLYAFSSNAKKGPLNYLNAWFVAVAILGVIIYYIQLLFGIFISTCCRSEQTPPEVEIDYEANATVKDIKIDYGKIRWFLSNTVVLLVIALVTAFYKPLEEVNKGLGNIGQEAAIVFFVFYFFEFLIEICKCGFWGYKWSLGC